MSVNDRQLSAGRSVSPWVKLTLSVLLLSVLNFFFK